MINFKPQKGKAFDKLSQEALREFNKKEFMVSTKFDGNQVFINKQGENVRFFTSDWKEFYVPHIANDLAMLNDSDFTIMGEFMHGCDGKLGDRSKSAKLTTYRTNFSKGLTNSVSDEIKANIKLFDIFEPHLPYTERLDRLRGLRFMQGLEVVDSIRMTGSVAMEYSRELANDGWEGAMLVEPKSKYMIGKRVNHAIKLKHRKSADLLCIDVEAGIGKCDGIGSLVLQDSKGRIVKVGSGLDYSSGTREGSHFIGKIIEIEYEQIMDTYIQPVFKCIRDDKDVEDID